MLTDDKLAELEAIGFEFQVGPIQPYRDPSMIKTWDERFKEMLEFKESNGHCMVPQTYVNSGLGHWVHAVSSITFVLRFIFFTCLSNVLSSSVFRVFMLPCFLSNVKNTIK